MNSIRRFHIVEQIGPKRSLTPDGFLICHDVPIARTGLQLYAPPELPLDEYEFSPPPDGLYRVHRSEAEVFAPEAIISVAGKPVTNEHPEDDVNPKNYRDLSCGHAMHPRRGEGIDDDALLADLFITDPAMMAEIEEGKRELSCGYDVDYFELSPGVLEQRNIRINHVALVKKGRCGPRCSIGDSDIPAIEEITMAAPTRRSLKDRIMACFVKDDKRELSTLMEEIEEQEARERSTRDDDAHGMTQGGGVHLHLGGHGGGDEGPPPWFKEHVEGNDRRIADLEGNVGKLAEAFQKWAGQEEKEPHHDAEEPEESAGEAPPEEIEGEIEEEAPAGSEEHDAGVPPEFKEHQKEKADDESEEEEEKEEAEAKDAKPRDRKRGKDRRKGKDKAKDQRVRDSAVLEHAYGDTLALAEVLVPGIQAPAFNRAAAPEHTLSAIRDLRCRALDIAAHNPGTREIIESVIGRGRSLDVRRLKAKDLRTTFRAIGAAAKAVNNSRLRPTTDLMRPNGSQAAAMGPIKTLGDYQKMLNSHYAPKA